jgi:DNA-binding NarL/FixJ family response regulator
MILLVQATVLTVGIDGRREVLQELPIRLISVQSGVEAASSFKNESIDSVISNWDLIDMPDGTFLRRLRGIRPNIPTIAVIKTDNYAQEISARSLGVSAVLTDGSSDEHFREVVRQVLGLKDVASIRGIRALKGTTEREKT